MAMKHYIALAGQIDLSKYNSCNLGKCVECVQNADAYKLLTSNTFVLILNCAVFRQKVTSSYGLHVPGGKYSVPYLVSG